jgi:hypothetical protein
MFIIHRADSVAAGVAACRLMSSLLRFAFGQKIWHTIFFASKVNFKIFPKLLPKPRRASPFLKNSPAMVLPRYLAWKRAGKDDVARWRAYHNPGCATIAQLG